MQTWDQSQASDPQVQPCAERGWEWEGQPRGGDISDLNKYQQATRENQKTTEPVQGPSTVSWVLRTLGPFCMCGGSEFPPCHLPHHADYQEHLQTLPNVPWGNTALTKNHQGNPKP